VRNAKRRKKTQHTRRNPTHLTQGRCIPRLLLLGSDVCCCCWRCIPRLLSQPAAAAASTSAAATSTPPAIPTHLVAGRRCGTLLATARMCETASTASAAACATTRPAAGGVMRRKAGRGDGLQPVPLRRLGRAHRRVDHRAPRPLSVLGSVIVRLSTGALSKNCLRSLPDCHTAEARPSWRRHLRTGPNPGHRRHEDHHRHGHRNYAAARGHRLLLATPATHNHRMNHRVKRTASCCRSSHTSQRIRSHPAFTRE